MFKGFIDTVNGKTIDFSGQDLTEVLLEMFISLQDEEPKRIVVNRV
jgi:endonuclease V-like protein UPF0215 family